MLLMLIKWWLTIYKLSQLKLEPQWLQLELKLQLEIILKQNVVKNVAHVRIAVHAHAKEMAEIQDLDLLEILLILRRKELLPMQPLIKLINFITKLVIPNKLEEIKQIHINWKTLLVELPINWMHKMQKLRKWQNKKN